MTFRHTPVLLAECLDALQVEPDGTYLDGTLGGAGHATEIAKRLQTGRLYGFDRDFEAIKAATKRLSSYQDNVAIVRDNYKNAVAYLRENGVKGLDGILLDLGVSSPQIDDASRGFSYMQDAPLDMRMDKDDVLRASDIVNTWTEEDLVRILKDYGEERFAKPIAKRIVERRKTAPIETTFALNDCVYAAVPKKARKEGSHPSKRVFQALRIACNEELTGLDDCLNDMIDFLLPKGRLCVISFHSLEDRIVKTVFKTAENPCVCPPSFPKCVCGKRPKGRIVTKKAIAPTDEECRQNARAKSAKLRVFEKGE